MKRDIYLSIFLVLAVSITVVLEALLSPLSLSYGWEIDSPEKINTGQIVFIDIFTDNSVKDISLRFLGRNFSSFPTEKPGLFKAFVAAGLKDKAGVFPIEVLEQGKNVVLKENIEVIKKEYPEEHLKVAKKMVDFPPKILKRVLDDQQAVKKACSVKTSSRFWSSPFAWPVNSKVLSPFGLRRFFNGQPRSPHSGADLRASEGTPIKAANDGRVVLARDCYLSGNTVVIDHGAGLFTLYAHLSNMDVKTGLIVKRGETIGSAGSTGRVTGPHLHWGVSIEGTRVDPISLMEVAGVN